jgi:alpha-galactosidase
MSTTFRLNLLDSNPIGLDGAWCRRSLLRRRGIALGAEALALFTALVLTGLSVSAQVLAPTPPMGWNSWDSFGTGVTEEEVKANADYMAENLKSHGWQYIVVDIQWSEPNPKTHGYRPNAELVMDEYGRLMPAPNRFPSAANGNGFKPLADYVHSKGLRFGIHIMRGIPRRAVDANLPIHGSKYKAADVANKESICRWNSDMYGVDTSKPGGTDYYDSIVELYKSWGLDFIKADDMFGMGPAGDHSTEIAALSQSIRKSGRPIVLSLSPGTRDASKADFIAKYAQMWRISGDFWDRWIDLKNQFPRLNTWSPHVRVGGWPDADMLPLGHIGIRAERGEPRMSLLSHDEQITLITLWSIARSPLMFGGNLPDNDAFTLSLLTSDEVLAANQKGTSSRQLFANGNQIAWVSESGDRRSKYLAVFNIGDTADEDIKVNWSDLGLSGKVRMRDLWGKKDSDAAQDGQSFKVKPHSAIFLRLAPGS